MAENEMTFAKVGVPRRLQMKLKQPLHGAITPNWDGTLVFEINFENSKAKLAHWNIELELVCAEDLRTEVVRRRAVFQWNDSVRLETLKGYAIQKITQTGSTHFPMEFLRCTT
jgi:hypothetical protein